MSLERRLRQAERRDLPELSVVERRIVATLGQAQRILPHPVVGIVIATFIAFTGRGELALRSYGILAIVVWLSVNLWAWLLPKRDKYHFRYILGWTTTNALLIGMLGIMWWWMDGKLKDQQEDVYSKLSIQASSSGNKGELSMFSVTNNGATDIGHHRIFCRVNFEGWSHGTWAANGGVDIQIVDSDVPLKGNGGTETTFCLATSSGPPPLLCADMTVEAIYVLETQPSNVRVKRLRFVGRYNGNDLTWYGEPVDAHGNFCGGPNA